MSTPYLSKISFYLVTGIVIFWPAYLLVGCVSTPKGEELATQTLDTPTPVLAPPTSVPATTVPQTASVALDPTVEASPTHVSEPATMIAGPTFGSGGYALRFFGTGSDDIDRVKIPLDASVTGQPAPPADVGAQDFTLEWWLKANPEENGSGPCTLGNDNWITGNIIFDRDIWGNGDYGDYGVSLAGGRIAFGVNNGASGEGICSITNVADGQWHHIAVARRQSDGWLAIFVNGQLEAQADGPDGDISYRDERPTEYEDDPFLVIGAEKHDAGLEYPSFSGWLDEVRLSDVLRYMENFAHPAEPFQPDVMTVALWHFDEGRGEVIGDATPGGLSHGLLKVGGPNHGPQWVISDAPLGSH